MDSDTMKTKKNSNNKIIYLSYFIQGFFTVYISTFMNVYLVDLGFSPESLAFVSIFTYGSVLIKPILAVIMDRKQSSNLSKIIALSGALLFGISSVMLAVIPPLSMIILFTALLSIIYLGMVSFDSSIDTLMLSLKNQSRKKVLVIYNTLSGVGGMVSTLVNIIFSGGSFGYMMLFIIAGIFSLLLIILIMKSEYNPIFTAKNESIENVDAEKDSEKVILESNISQSDVPNVDRPLVFVILAMVFAFFINIDKMTDWIMEPFIKAKFGEESWEWYSLIVLFLLVFMILGYLTTLKFRDSSDKLSIKYFNILILALLYYAFQYILFPFLSFWILLVMQLITFYFAGITMIALIEVFVVCSKTIKQNYKNTVFQIMVFFYTVAAWIGVPLGLILSSMIPVEYVFVLSGFLLLIGAGALVLMKISLKKSNK